MTKVKEALSPLSLRAKRSKLKRKEEPMSKLKEALSKEKTKEGLPKEAFAIVGDPQDPTACLLPWLP